MWNNFRTNVTFLAKMLAQKSFFKVEVLEIRFISSCHFHSVTEQGLLYQSLCLANLGKFVLFLQLHVFRTFWVCFLFWTPSGFGWRERIQKVFFMNTFLGKKSSHEYQHQKLSSLYIRLVKYIAGCIHTLIQDVCLHEAYGSQFGKALQSGWLCK